MAGQVAIFARTRFKSDYYFQNSESLEPLLWSAYTQYASHFITLKKQVYHNLFITLLLGSVA